MATHACAFRGGPYFPWWRQTKLFDVETGHPAFDNNEYICDCRSAPSSSSGVWLNSPVPSEIRTFLWGLIGALRRHAILWRSVQTGCRPLSVLFLYWFPELLQWEVSTTRCHLLGTLRMCEDTLLCIQINHPTRCINLSDLLLVFQIQLNMFRAFSCPSSGAYHLQQQPLV